MKTTILTGLTKTFLLAIAISWNPMAYAENCADGTLVGGVYDHITVKKGDDCYAIGVVVLGDFTADRMDQVSIVDSSVNGMIKITNSVSAFVHNTVVNGDGIVAKANDFSTLAENTVNQGAITINSVDCEQFPEVVATGNQVFDGTLRVNCNEKATVTGNTVHDGDIICRDNDRLDSKDNDAFFGTVDCARNVGIDD